MDATVSVQGTHIPQLGFGTARMTGQECKRAVETALETGYRHIDTAQLYDNEDAVGQALESSSIAREDVFLTTKLHTDNLAYDAVLESTVESLERLRVETVDLLLIHAPRRQPPVSETIQAMNELQESGAVDHIGVSNFSRTQLEAALEHSQTPIVTNQVKYHPYHQQDELLSYCIDREVCLTAYSPLAEGAVVGDERLATIGERTGASAPQVALGWLCQQPMVSAIPKASSPAHIEENAGCLEFELSAAEMRAVFDIGGGCSPAVASRLGL